MIIEVLSPSTESIDRREKALNYRWVPELQDYAMIAQDKPEVTVLRRHDQWGPTIYSAPEDIIEFSSIGLSVPIARIYAGVGA